LPPPNSSRAPGHDVHVYEKFAKAGRPSFAMAFPNFKMEKHVIDRRVAQMEAEGRPPSITASMSAAALRGRSIRANS